jgi:hypothetical protein
MTTKKKKEDDKPKDKPKYVGSFAFIYEYADQAKKLLGISEEWQIQFTRSDCPGNIQPPCSGSCAADSVYFNAEIELSRTLGDAGPKLKEIVFHEVGHIAHSEIDRAVQKIIMQVPKEDQEFYQELYSDALEHYIQRQARVLSKLETN